MFQHNTMFFPHPPFSSDGQTPRPPGYRERTSSDLVEWSLTGPKVQMYESRSSKTARTPYLYVFGGDHAVQTNFVVERYKLNPGEWEEVATMPFAGVGVRVARYWGDIWDVGGLSRRDVYMFDTGKNEFIQQQRHAMQRARQYLGLAVLAGRLFAIGGEDDGAILKTVEVCRPLLAWRSVSSLNTPRSDFGVAVFKKKIFVAGGKTSSTDLRTDSVETYSFGIDRWTQAVRKMDIARSGFSLVVSANSMYAVGGDANVSISKCDNGEQWESVPSKIGLKRCRQRGTAVNRCGMFYLVGGERNGGNTTYVDALSKWGPHGSWRALPDMSTERSQAAVLLVTLTEDVDD